MTPDAPCSAGAEAVVSNKNSKTNFSRDKRKILQDNKTIIYLLEGRHHNCRRLSGDNTSQT